MRIEIGRYAGFCRGVKHAVDGAFACARENAEIVYADGELIHNPQTLELLRRHGMETLGDADESVESARGRVVIVRAHGVPPERLVRLRAVAREVCNLTCRDVAKVQGIVRKYSRRGFSVVIFGKADHPEVRGLLGHATNGFTVLTPEDIDRLPDLDRVALVSQTTMNHEAFSAVAERVAARFDDAEIIDTICDATELRQNEVREMAKRSDAVLVIGGERSSNTRRLYEIAVEETRAHLVSDATEVRNLNLAGVRSLAVTAGASTPDWLIHEVVEEVRRTAHRPLARALRGLLLFSLYSKLFVALGAFLLSLAVADNLAVPWSLEIAVLVSLYYLAMSLMNAYTSRASVSIDNARRYRFMIRWRGVFAAIFAASVAVVLVIAVSLGHDVLWLTLLSLLLGVAYNLSYLPLTGENERILFLRKRDLLALKSVVISVAVTLLLNGLPLLGRLSSPSGDPSFADVVTSLGFSFSIYFVFMLMFTREALFELKTAQTDRIAGVSSLLHLLSSRQITAVLYALPAVLLVIMVVGVVTGLYPLDKAKYFVAVVYSYVVIALARRRRLLYDELGFELVVDSGLYVAGIVALL